MTKSPTVVAVSGSCRESSYTHTALSYVLKAACEAGGNTEMVDLGGLNIPVYNPDEPVTGDVIGAMQQVREADAVALGTPVYHGSYSGALKNFHDFCGWDEYEETTVGLVAVAGGGSFGTTLDHLRSTVRGVHGWTLPRQVGIRNASQKFEPDSSAPDSRQITDEDIDNRLQRLGEELVEYAYIANSDHCCE